MRHRLAERFVWNVHVLLTGAEQHCPTLRVRDVGDVGCQARLPRTGFSAEQNRFHGTRCCPITSRLDQRGEVAAADEKSWQRGDERPRERDRQHGARSSRLRPCAAVIDQLVDRLDSVDAAQQLAPQEANLRTLRNLAAHERRRRAGEEHLATRSNGPHASRPIDCPPVIVAPALHRLTGVDAHAHQVGVAAGHGSSTRRRCASAAAANAVDVLMNTENVLSPSPLCFRTMPPYAATAAPIRTSWRVKAASIATGARSHNPVESTTSVNRKLTRPPGSGSPPTVSTAIETTVADLPRRTLPRAGDLGCGRAGPEGMTRPPSWRRYTVGGRVLATGRPSGRIPDCRASSQRPCTPGRRRTLRHERIGSRRQRRLRSPGVIVGLAASA